MRIATILGLTIGVLGFLIPEQACGCRIAAPRPLRQEAGQAPVILYTWVKHVDVDPPNSILGVSEVLRATPEFGGRQEIQIPRALSVAPEPSNSQRFLLFGELDNGRLDFYRGVTATPAFVDYFRGLLDLNAKDPADVLAYCSRYLEHADREVAQDAHLEFAAAEQKDVFRVGKKLSADRLRGWLANEKLQPNHRQFYALLLGCCGTNADADLLVGLLQNAARKEDGIVHEMLTAYVMLRPREGWEYLVALARDPNSTFMVRYATLRTARIFHELRPDLVSKADRISLLRHLLEQPDMADLPIEDLRRWGEWDLCGTVISLWYRGTHSEKIIQRSILRYAVSCPDPRAKKLLDDVRKTDPSRVRDVEELVRLDASKPNAQEK